MIIICIAVRNKYIVKSHTNWKEDESGKKFTEYVIKPIKNYLYLIIKTYRCKGFEKEYKNKCNNVEEQQEYMDTYNLILKLESYMSNDKFNKDIIRELSHYLKYLEEEIIDFEEELKLETLKKEILEYNNLLLNENINNIYDSDLNIDRDREQYEKPRKIKKSKNLKIDTDNNNVNNQDLDNPYIYGYSTSDDDFDNTPYNNYAHIVKNLFKIK
jgi:hypothetical protein